MIISIEKLRELVPSTALSDDRARAKLLALEIAIRKHTNNNFQKRNFRTVGNIVNGVLVFDRTLFKDGDTIEISNSKYNNGLYVLGEDAEMYDESNVLITKVEYPPDVIEGVVNMLEWETKHRDKVGVKSESISRYSVTYYDIESKSVIGFPSGIVAFLTPYIKARF